MSNLQRMGSADQRRAKDINLKELFLIIKRRFLVIVITIFIASFVGYILDQATVVPLYNSSTRIIIGADGESRKTLQVIIRDSSILDIVIKKLGLKETSDQLADKISVASLENSQVVSITVVDTDPVMAAKIADTTAETFRQEVPKIVGEDYIQILSKAKVNSVSINPENKNKVFYGIIGGLVIGIGLAFFLETLDDRIRSKKEIEELLGIPVLGRVPKINNRNVKKAAKTSKLEVKMRGETVDYK
ncbi:YveK family protein [Neobacillus mesonae]|uniref:YveK family protein n=1 Tax=Neobacillus mesonae TaxID=1193713 RepID=UPI00203C5983|nr:capsular biosynthesis protein [Neobacillus mesonae]MCM3568207.1 capsular biosynthesis protein [Neobacillus mesonae]